MKKQEKKECYACSANRLKFALCDSGLHGLRMDLLLLVSLLEQVSSQVSPEVPSKLSHPVIP